MIAGLHLLATIAVDFAVLAIEEGNDGDFDPSLAADRSGLAIEPCPGGLGAHAARFVEVRTWNGPVAVYAHWDIATRPHHFTYRPGAGVAA